MISMISFKVIGLHVKQSREEEGTHAVGRLPERELLYRCRPLKKLNEELEPHAAGMVPADVQPEIIKFAAVGRFRGDFQTPTQLGLSCMCACSQALLFVWFSHLPADSDQG